MKSKNILTLVGGISVNSLNKKLLRAVQAEAPVGFVFHDFEIKTLPYFSQDIENEPPDSVLLLKDAIRSADGVLFITPEYNRSFPGVLKNAVDWGSRPYGQNLWDNKPAAVMGASPGNIGTFGAQHHLRQSLAYLNMRVMGQPEFYLKAAKVFNDEGKLVDNSVRGLIYKFLDNFSGWIDENTLEKNEGPHQNMIRESHLEINH